MANLARLLRDKMRMLREDAAAVSHVVENAFRGQDELSDDELDAEVRQVFYDLQDQDILDVRRHEYEKDGRLLRGYMWHVRQDQSPFLPTEAETLPPEEHVYRRLKEHAWERHRPRDQDPLLHPDRRG